MFQSLQHGLGRWIDEVSPVCGEVRLIGRNENVSLFGQREPKRIMEADLLEDGLNLMISIFPFPQHTKHQINFRW